MTQHEKKHNRIIQPPQQQPNNWDGNHAHLIAYGRDYGYIDDRPNIPVERQRWGHAEHVAGDQGTARDGASEPSKPSR